MKIQPLAAFPLPFKSRKLKSQIENTPNGKVSILQKLTYRKKRFYAHMRCFYMATLKHKGLSLPLLLG